MSRKDEIMSLFEDDDTKLLVGPLVDELIFIEGQIEDLKKEPFIRYHPANRAVQKATPAGRLYKDLLAKETDITRTLCQILKKNGSEAESSPLREYLATLR